MKIILYSASKLPSSKNFFWIIFFTGISILMLVAMVFGSVYLKSFLFNYYEIDYQSSLAEKLIYLLHIFDYFMIFFSLPFLIALTVYFLKLFNLDKNRNCLIFNKNNLYIKISLENRQKKEIQIFDSNLFQIDESSFKINCENQSFIFSKNVESGSLLTHLMIWNNLGFPISNWKTGHFVKVKIFLEYYDKRIFLNCHNLNRNINRRVELINWN